MKKALAVILVLCFVSVVSAKKKVEKKTEKKEAESFDILNIGDDIQYNVPKKKLVKGDKDEAIDTLVREYLLLQQKYVLEAQKNQRLLIRYIALVDKILAMMADELKEAQK